MAEDENKDVHMPRAGIDLSEAFSRQPNRLVMGQYCRTTPVAKNVRTFEPVSGRSRGGARPGISRFINALVSDESYAIDSFEVSGQTLTNITYQRFIQCLFTLVGTGYSAPGGGVQTSSSGRIVTLVAVAQGQLKVANPGDTSWTSVVNATSFPLDPPFNVTGIVRSTQLGQKLYFVDGTNFRVYDPETNTVSDWVATRGELPVDAEDNTPTILCTWRGRIVMVLGNQWFMSAVDDATDWEYAGQDLDGDGILEITPTMAVSGSNAPQGLAGDIVNVLIPYVDDLLIFGGDSSIRMMRGDPAMGGNIDKVSDAIGMAYGKPWCSDPTGNIYFFSNRTGIWTMVPGMAPKRISQQIEPLLSEIDTGTNTITMAWDDNFQGLMIFVTPTAGSAAATHFYYDLRANAWFTHVHGNNDHNSLCCCVFDGNEASDRVVLIGSWDGYVRFIDPTATTDDGEPIESEVVIGPFVTKNLDQVMLGDATAAMAVGSADVTYEVYTGKTAEIALAKMATDDYVKQGTWKEGRNSASLVRQAGYATYLRIKGVGWWAMESIRISLKAMGRVLMRSK